MIGTITLKIEGAAPGGLTRKEWNLVRKAAYANAAFIWHSEFLPKHFTKRGAVEYGYTPRSGERSPPGSKRYRKSYTATKQRRFGHSRPLVFTGRSMRQTLRRKISATSKRARVLIKAGDIGQKHPSGRIDMADELTRVSSGEIREIAQRTAVFVQAALRDIRGAKEIRI